MPHHHVALEVNNPIFNLLAVTWRNAFKEAARQRNTRSRRAARADIVAFFGLHNVQRLYECGCITWSPE